MASQVVTGVPVQHEPSAMNELQRPTLTLTLHLSDMTQRSVFAGLLWPSAPTSSLGYHPTGHASARRRYAALFVSMTPSTLPAYQRFRTTIFTSLAYECSRTMIPSSLASPVPSYDDLFIARFISVFKRQPSLLAGSTSASMTSLHRWLYQCFRATSFHRWLYQCFRATSLHRWPTSACKDRSLHHWSSPLFPHNDHLLADITSTFPRRSSTRWLHQYV